MRRRGGEEERRRGGEEERRRGGEEERRRVKMIMEKREIDEMWFSAMQVLGIRPWAGFLASINILASILEIPLSYQTQSESATVYK